MLKVGLEMMQFGKNVFVTPLVANIIKLWKFPESREFREFLGIPGISWDSRKDF